MKTHTTNYFNTFIAVAADCPAAWGEIPPAKADKPPVAALQFEMLIHDPYKYTSDEVLFSVHATRKGLKKEELPAEKELFFSKGQPCFRCSPLAKRYGWGVHSNAEGRIAIYAVDSDKYRELSNDDNLQQVKAMRQKRK